VKHATRTLAAAVVLAIGCTRAVDPAPAPPDVAPADLVFLGDHILTVDPATKGATAVAVRGDTIVRVGDRGDVEALIGEATRIVELGARALAPGFIDAHGHLALAMGFVDLLNASSPPVGPMESVEDIVEALAPRASIRLHSSTFRGISQPRTRWRSSSSAIGTAHRIRLAA
jgi:predicted amidohydrolase YtcJ